LTRRSQGRLNPGMDRQRPPRPSTHARHPFDRYPFDILPREFTLALIPLCCDSSRQ
jgi:hypothetical protein